MSERPRASLPVEMTSFVGRREEIAAVADLVGAHRLVTLVGPGGVGKTRLASQAGASLIDAFSGGVWFTNLSLTSQPDLVPALVAGPFDVGDVGTSRPRSLTQVLADYFAEGQLLLILDNCEHVPDGVAELVTTLLRSCPNLSVLATSRPRDLAADPRPPRRGRLPRLTPWTRFGRSEREVGSRGALP
jgi:non-specific serine/threonine protein kinase